MDKCEWWLEGRCSISNPIKKQEMNDLILEILRKTGTCRLTRKKVAYNTIDVVAKAAVDKNGIIKFDYSVYEKKKREGNYYDTNTCELVTPDRGNNHFGLTMNLIMTVMEAYSETPCYLMHNQDLEDVRFNAKLIEELTGKILNFEKRAKVFETLLYFKQFEKYKNFHYEIDKFPFNYCIKDEGQAMFTFFELDEPIAEDEGDSILSQDREMAYLCMNLLRENNDIKNEALEYISELLDMSLEERTEEAKRKHKLDFLGNTAVFLPGAALVKIYAEAFNIDFWKLWNQIGKPGYWDVTKPNEIKKQIGGATSRHTLYKLYGMNNEDDFIGIWSHNNMILSQTMLENLEEYKRRYFKLDEISLTNYDMLSGLRQCIDDLQSLWGMDKYIDKDMLVEFINKKEDLRYKKAVFVLQEMIADEIELFSEFTDLQVRKWIIQRVNRNRVAKRYWHYVDILSNKAYRKELLGF